MNPASPKENEGLSVFGSGALYHPVGLGTVPVGPRIFMAACALLALALVPTIPALVVCIVMLLTAAAALGVLVPVFRSWRTIVPVSISLLVIYAWAYPGSTDYVGIFGVQSFLVGLLIAARLVGFVTVLYLLLLSTGQLAIVRWAGDVNEDIGVMVSLTLSVIPVMKRHMDTTIQAQQARGLEMGGSLVRKIRVYLAVLIPVVVKSLVRAYGMAALMHVRGYGSGRRVKPIRRTTLPVVASYAVGILAVVAGVTLRVSL